MKIMIIRTIIISIPDLYVFRVPVNSWQQEGHVTKSHLPLKHPKFQLLDLQAVITRIIFITSSFIHFLLAIKWGWFNNRTGMSVDIGWAREIHLGSVLIWRKILWVLFCAAHTFVKWHSCSLTKSACCSSCDEQLLVSAPECVSWPGVKGEK